MTSDSAPSWTECQEICDLMESSGTQDIETPIGDAIEAADFTWVFHTNTYIVRFGSELLQDKRAQGLQSSDADRVNLKRKPREIERHTKGEEDDWS